VGCLLVGLIVWALLVGAAVTEIAGPDYPDWLFYSVFLGGPVLYLTWLRDAEPALASANVRAPGQLGTVLDCVGTDIGYYSE
jgi:hypothetical protein